MHKYTKLNREAPSNEFDSVLVTTESGSFQKRNIFKTIALDGEIHLFTADTDMGINKVTVVSSDNSFIREYNTQKSDPISKSA